METSLYGIDWDSSMVTDDADDDAERVHIVGTAVPLNEDDFMELCQSIDPLAVSDSNDHGITQYLETVDYVTRKVCNN